MNKIEFSSLKNREDMIIAFNQLKDDYYELRKENKKLEKIAFDNERYKKYWTKCKADLLEAIIVCDLYADIGRMVSNKEKSYFVTAYNDMCYYDNEPKLDSPYDNVKRGE